MRRQRTGAGHDEGEREVEGPDGGDTGVLGRGVRHQAERGLAEEGVVTGFDRDGRGEVVDEEGVEPGDAGRDVDDGADADGGDDLREPEEGGCVVHGGELVRAGGDEGAVVVGQDRFEGGDVDCVGRGG